MQLTNEFNFFRKFSSYVESATSHRKKITAVTLFGLFTKAQAQCNNQLTFPYELVNGPDHVGNCIPLDMPASVPNTSISVILSFQQSISNLTEKVSAIPGVQLSNFTEHCLEQQFTRVASWCRDRVSVWGLKVLTDQNITADDRTLSLIEQETPCPEKNSEYFNLLMTFVAFTLFCVLLYSILKTIDYVKNHKKPETTENIPLNKL